MHRGRTIHSPNSFISEGLEESSTIIEERMRTMFCQFNILFLFFKLKVGAGLVNLTWNGRDDEPERARFLMLAVPQCSL